MKKIIIILLVIIIGFLAYFALKIKTPTVVPGQTNSTPINQTQMTATGKANVSDLVSFSIVAGQEVSGVMNATGEIQGGYFFEANILSSILDVNKKIIRAGHGTATTDWMTSDPVSFSTTLDFTGLPKGPAFVSIHNDNPSDMRENDKEILIPVVIK